MPNHSINSGTFFIQNGALSFTKLTSTTHVVGRGRFGFGISDELDCHVYLLNSGSELALVDPELGLGRDFDTILQISAMMVLTPNASAN